MALHWEDSAFTTPSLTPRPQNRPLKIGKLTPCKIPGVAGSAGHCEPGVGRFTDPHPLTCSFFTPSLRCFMFGLCERPLQARPSLLFPFLPFFCPLVLSSAWMGLAFPHPGSPLSWIRSQLGHTALTGPITCFAGVRFPARFSKPHTGPHRAGFGFSPPKQTHPSPFRGRGWVSPVLGLLEFSCREARCFSAGKDGYFVSEGFSRQLPVATAGHSWPNRAGLGLRWCRFPTPPSDRPQIAAQGRVWLSLSFSGALWVWQG